MGDTTGRSMPIPGQYISDVIKGKRPGGENAVKLASYSYARPWDGLPKSWSSYA